MRPYPIPLALTLALALGLAACARSSSSPPIAYEVVRKLPHDPEAFTQGLLFREGRLFESTGLYGQSTLREVDLETGRVLRRLDLPPDLFGEGLAYVEGQLFQLTWREGVVRVYDAATFEVRATLPLSGQGWGLTTWSNQLVASDGSALLRFHEPATMARRGELIVTDREQLVSHLNELEIVEGALFANVWGADRIARIDLQTGRVTGWLDCGPLIPPDLRSRRENVLNGIAYDPATRRLYVTGKNWPVLYELKLRP